jgi:hypothetical protein
LVVNVPFWEIISGNAKKFLQMIVAFCTLWLFHLKYSY